MAARPSRSRWFSTPALAAVAVVVLAAGGGTAALIDGSGPTKAQRAAAAAADEARREAAAQALAQRQIQQAVAAVSIIPASGATDVPLDSPVTVSANGATILSVAVTAGSAAIPGTFTAATNTWTPTTGYAAGTVYTVTVGLSANGAGATRSSTFTTLTPPETATATVYPGPGSTVGVGQPITIEFSHDITSAAARSAIVSRLMVSMTHPQAGAWYWFSDDELHFRPQSFWTADQPVQVSGDLDGIDLGGGAWAAGTIADNFRIGDSQISYANLQTEIMTVTHNGATVYTFPISGGRPKYPTMDGIHLVLDKEPVVHMVSSTVGIPVNSPDGYDEYVYDDVHISMSGEYVHAAPWSVSAQGVTNVSHGCINVSPSDAKTFYDFSNVGDIVEVTGSSRPALTTDGGVRDWSGPPWSDWTPAHVSQLGAPATTATTAAPTTTAPTATIEAPTTSTTLGA
jgi:lipoprotein-anchoring transpeptidase ErfK/SrfK